MSKRIAVIFDTQVKPGIDMSYLTHIGRYLAEKRPDYIVHIGDHWDMPSLSSYDFGKKDYEGRRYLADIEAGCDGIDKLMAPILAYNYQQLKNKHKLYKPEMHFFMGNHEERVNRAVNNDAKLEGLISQDDFNLDYHGWIVHPFLEVGMIEGVAFSHYFVTGVAGRPATTASALLAKKHMSCVAGHQQGRQIATAYKADGRPITAIICGSSYPHDEKYLGQQGNKHWRGIAMLNEVEDGSFDECFISLNYLARRYGE